MLETKAPPSNVEAEQRLIVAALLDSALPGSESVVVEVEGIVTAEDFYNTLNRKLWATIVDLSQNGGTVDPDQLSLRLKGVSNGAEAISAHLSDLLSKVPTATDPKGTAVLIREMALRRQMAESGNRLYRAAWEATDTTAAIDQAEAAVSALGLRQRPHKARSAKDLCLDQADRLDRLAKQKGKLSGIPTGIEDLDAVLSGMQRGDLYVMAARPSVGKTAMALHITRRATPAVPVDIFSLEMSAAQLMDRLTAAEGRVNLARFRDAAFTDDERRQVDDAAGRLYDLPIHIDDQAGLHVKDIRRRARQMVREHQVGLVVIDHLQLIRTDRQATRDREIGEITAALKGMAKDLDFPVLLLSQLNRALEARPNPHKRPKLADLRDSGNIEQDADVVLFLYRPDLYGDACEWPTGSGRKPYAGQFEINIAKHRNGPLGTVMLRFDPETGRFGPLI